MSIVQTAADRILPPLSTLMQRDLSLTSGQSPERSHSFSIRASSPRMSIVSSDGRPFSELERQLLSGMFDVIRIADESDARFAELEQRMLSLQRENLDLIVKNRVLSEVSSRDSLTGLFNRSYVVEKLDSEINRSLRNGSPMSLLMLDIDHFKQVNDSYGHGVGDQVLQSVGKLLRESCRVYDVPGRFGGEEFCVVLPETRLNNTPSVADRIQRRLSQSSVTVGDDAITVTASIGIAALDSDPGEGVLSPAALLDRADRALYSAKHRGRNRVEFWNGATSGSTAQAVSH